MRLGRASQTMTITDNQFPPILQTEAILGGNFHIFFFRFSFFIQLQKVHGSSCRPSGESLGAQRSGRDVHRWASKREEAPQKKEMAVNKMTIVLKSSLRRMKPCDGISAQVDRLD